MSLSPKNWLTFQHYKDRKPPWIKLHRALLDDYAFACLPLASQALAPRLWLLASEYLDGKITASIQEIAFRLHVTIADLEGALKPLVDAEFFADDSGLLAPCKQETRLEEETQVQTQDETEAEDRSLRSRALVPASRETNSDWPEDFRERFWSKYPRKQSRKSAFKALDKIRRSGEVEFARLMAGIEKIPVHDPTFIPHAATWLNGARWDDEPVKIGGNHGNGISNNRTNSFAGSAQTHGDAILAGMGRIAARVAERRHSEGRENGAFQNGSVASEKPSANAGPEAKDRGAYPLLAVVAGSNTGK